jgi:Fe-S cluster assembly protein SufD
MDAPATTDRRDWYLSLHEEFERGLDGPSADLRPLRRQALERFAQLGFPTTRDEQWRYTSVAPLARTEFRPAAAATAAQVDLAALEPFSFPGLECSRLVFVDGHWSPELSAVRALPRGARVTDLATGLREFPELVRGHLEHGATEGTFASLNGAFLQDGAFVYLPANAVLEHPVHLLFLSTAGEQPAFSSPRTLVVAEPNTRASLIESYAGLGPHPYLTNAVTEVILGEGAGLDHYRIQREGPAGFHVSTHRAHEAAGCAYTAHTITLGGHLVRNHLTTVLDGEGVQSTLDGLYLVDGQEHVDNHTLVEHAQPHGSSHELYKGILSGQGTGVFRGRILVRPGAQKTDAYQSNRNLLLSTQAQVDTQPQLEIYADDVKCSHGGTVGQLDPDAIFYLRTRGLGEDSAFRLLTHAFAGQVLERIPLAPVRNQLDRLVVDKLEAGYRNRGPA